jgi:hypothetical protein
MTSWWATGRLDLYRRSLQQHPEALRSQNEDIVAVAAREASKESQSAVTGQAESAKAKPVRGVVLEFATKMRQSRGREVLLNA